MLKTTMELILSESSWKYIQRKVIPAITLSGEVAVLPVPPSDSDPRSSTGRLSVWLTETDAQQIIEELLDVFALEGLQPDGEPNYLGRYVESLVDIFNECIWQAEDEENVARPEPPAVEQSL